MRLPLLIAALILASPVHGGAWMRAEGDTFLSFSTSMDETGEINGGIYLEHGLRPKLTLGLKVDMDMTAGQMGDGSAIVFMRKPINTGQRAFKLAYEVGLGSTIGDDSSGLGRVALNYGRGVSFGDKAGWITMDTAIEWVSGTGDMTLKLDGTVGMTLNPRFKVMMQVFHTQSDAANTTTFAPSLVWQPKSKQATSYQLGLEADDGIIALKLGMWKEF